VKCSDCERASVDFNAADALCRKGVRYADPQVKTLLDRANAIVNTAHPGGISCFESTLMTEQA
jgi:hypothetical protein